MIHLLTGLEAIIATVSGIILGFILGWIGGRR